MDFGHGGVKFMGFFITHYHYSKVSFSCHSSSSHYLMQGFILIFFHFHTCSSHSSQCLN